MPSESTSPTATTPTSNTNAVKSPAMSPCDKAEGNDTKAAGAASFDPTEYVQRQRITKGPPPKPAYNPLQFIQVKPCNLYQSAQDQLKRAEEVKKVKEVKKEDAEDWQCNLDSWKSSRRKRVEHIIERVVEVKKLEYEEHDRNRKKSKTFSEMMEERGGRRKISLPVYAVEDDANDLSDLGIGTSSASGKSSLSEDFDNHSVISDNPDTEKSHSDIDNNSNHDHQCVRNGNGLSPREYVPSSSPGYETSSTAAPSSSPDPMDYPQFEGEYKNRNAKMMTAKGPFSKDSTPERVEKFVPKRPSVTKIEDRLVNFELKSSSTDCGDSQQPKDNGAKKDLPKVDILKRRELFEKEKTPERTNRSSGDFSQAPIMSIKERLSNLEKQREDNNSQIAMNRLSGDITSIKDRLSNLEKEKTPPPKSTDAKVAIGGAGSIKDRLSSLHSAVNAGVVKDDVIEEPVSKHQNPVVVGMAKKISPEKEKPSIPDVIQVESITMESTNLVNNDGESESMMMMTSIQDTVQEYVTLEQDTKVIMSTVKEEYREITDEDLFGSSDLTIDGTEDIEIDNLQQDTSVLEALDIAFEAIDKDNRDCVSSGPIIDQMTSKSVPETVATAPAAATANSNVTNINQIDRDDEDVDKFIDDLIKQNSEEIDDGIIEPISIDASMTLYEEETERDTESLRIEPDILPVITEKTISNKVIEPIYEVIEESPEPKPLKSALKQSSKKKKEETKEEPYYQTPKSMEPYYEVPNSNPIPLYENVDIFLTSVAAENKGDILSPIPAGVILEPPKVKPPPPPVMSDADESSTEAGDEEADEEIVETEENLRRMNSTKRIKKEIRNKRSSFLGIEGDTNDDYELKLSVAPPPDMSVLMREERRLEKQFLKNGLYDCSGESRDSGVSEGHSRQSSGPFVGSSEEVDDYPKNKETEFINVLERDVDRSSRKMNEGDWNHRNIDEASRMQNLEEQIREQEEVLRVERELLQLEQEELKRQRENLILRENLTRKDLDHGAKMLMSANCQSLQDINQKMLQNGSNLPCSSSSSNSSTTSSTFNVMSPTGYSAPKVPGSVMMPVDYRKSMPDLQNLALHDMNQYANIGRMIPPQPPAKPSRQLIGAYGQQACHTTSTTDLSEEYVQLRDRQQHQQHSPQMVGNMSRHTLHALSAVPKPKLTDVWVQQQVTAGRKSEPANSKYFPIQRKAPLTPHERMSGEPWIARKSDPKGLSYGKHWLIQEAEQRRIDQQRGVKAAPNPQHWPIKGGGQLHRKSMSDLNGVNNGNKPLPDSVIHTLTQRVQNRMQQNGSDRKRFDANPAVINSNASLDESCEVILPPTLSPLGNGNMDDKVLSVSGKKKCSHCEDELGRGAAMIIESLRLFYHIDCFKCCVCHVRLGDGLNGTDVRVRNQKLHCHNCYSSDDGIKFSCV